MERTYEYIEFVRVEEKPKTSVWSCRNRKSGDELGIVRWHGPWRRYCYFPLVQAVYSEGYCPEFFRETPLFGMSKAPVEMDLSRTMAHVGPWSKVRVKDICQMVEEVVKR